MLVGWLVCWLKKKKGEKGKKKKKKVCWSGVSLPVFCVLVGWLVGPFGWLVGWLEGWWVEFQSEGGLKVLKVPKVG